MWYSIGPRTVDVGMESLTVYTVISISVRRGRWVESTHPDHFLTYYRHTCGSSSDNFAIPYAQYGKSIWNGPLPAQVTADHSGQLVFPVYSSTLLHLPIPIFCCLPALLCWALKIGSQNWPMWLSGRGDEGVLAAWAYPRPGSRRESLDHPRH